MKSNDTNFVRRLQRQHEDALEFIVERYLPLIKGITHNVLGPLNNSGIIDECVNDVFLSIWNHAHKFKGKPEDFRKWAAAIAKFKAIDYYRKARRDLADVTDAADVQVVMSAEDELLLQEERTELLELIDRLEPVEREIFMMKYFLGASTESISAKLGLTRAAVDNRIYRGKKKLQQQAVNLQMGERSL
ncbi:DNA-directed RNA polymerase sigma-70 factor [Paenibacillus albidus]|uniref:DNA-directed RNA polymerase sigma-70 factor n=1 Tax=Paenibacillus albidus TaxID=2041023 RepID=A0A917BXV7_9BACL|nr:sigma-70 family RNA polymerase sigma factor [Paenibacillus albidus]GGF59765.1 DNA-directed RNA polymerase sigma-70 factor [Paenibacillus albidus]